MNNLLKKTVKALPMLPGNPFVGPKKLLLPGLSYLFKREFKASFDFLRTVDNIHILGGHAPQSVSLKGPAETEKNLLACTVSGEAQVLFFNISGSEFFHLYVCVGIARVRELLEPVWNKALLHLAGCLLISRNCKVMLICLNWISKPRLRQKTDVTACPSTSTGILLKAGRLVR